MKQLAFVFAAAAALAAPASAQWVQEVPAATAELRRGFEQAQATLRGPGVETRITPGRPYSAEAVTEFVQVLGDGNRITRSTSTKIYRDGEGRTRRETERSISINDPVSHVSYVLDPERRIATKASVTIAYASSSPVVADKMRIELENLAKAREAQGVGGGRGGGAGTAGAAGGGARGGGAEAVAGRGRGGATVTPEGLVLRSGPGESKTESLGQKTMEGVLAEGTRTTTVIPAGAVGNVQPITVVSEQWFSPELEVLVMTKHSDPRTGENTYRLTNVQRAEPDRSLFEVPSDYTVREQGRRTPLIRQ